jgi:hypothetical protein
MAFFGRYGDSSLRQLLLGCAHPLVPLLLEEFKVAVLFRPAAYGFGRARWRKDSQSRQQRVMLGGQVRPQFQTVVEAKGDATRTFHDAFLAALAHSLR